MSKTKMRILAGTVTIATVGLIPTVGAMKAPTQNKVLLANNSGVSKYGKLVITVIDSNTGKAYKEIVQNALEPIGTRVNLNDVVQKQGDIPSNCAITGMKVNGKTLNTSPTALNMYTVPAGITNVEVTISPNLTDSTLIFNGKNEFTGDRVGHLDSSLLEHTGSTVNLFTLGNAMGYIPNSLTVQYMKVNGKELPSIELEHYIVPNGTTNIEVVTLSPYTKTQKTNSKIEANERRLANISHKEIESKEGSIEFKTIDTTTGENPVTVSQGTFESIGSTVNLQEIASAQGDIPSNYVVSYMKINDKEVSNANIHNFTVPAGTTNVEIGLINAIPGAAQRKANKASEVSHTTNTTNNGVIQSSPNGSKENSKVESKNMTLPNVSVSSKIKSSIAGLPNTGINEVESHPIVPIAGGIAILGIIGGLFIFLKGRK